MTEIKREDFSGDRQGRSSFQWGAGPLTSLYLVSFLWGSSVYAEEEVPVPGLENEVAPIVVPAAELPLPQDALIAIESESVSPSPVEGEIEPSSNGGNVLPPLDPSSSAVDSDLSPVLTGPDGVELEGYDGDFLDDLLLTPEDPAIESSFELEDSWGGNAWGGYRLESYAHHVRGSELLTPGMGPPKTDQGFRFGLGIQANYDSNIRLLEKNEQDDYFLLISPGVEYRSAPPEGVPGVVTFRYEPIIRRHLNDTSFNSIDHLAVLDVSYDGSRGSFRAAAEYGEFAESNSEALAVTDTSSLSFLLEGAYRFSERISANVLLNYISEDVDPIGGVSNDSEVTSLKLALGWVATPQLTIGPAVRFAESDSDNLGKTETIGATIIATYQPVSIEDMQISVEGGYEERDKGGDTEGNMVAGLRVRYRMDEELRLRGAVEYQTISELSGVEFGGTTGGSERLTARFSAQYTPYQKLWSARAGVSVRSTPSDSASIGQSANSSRIDAELIRAMGIGTFSLGAEVEFIEYEGGANRKDDTTTSAFVRYARPVFQETTSFTSTLRWSENSGQRDWTRIQVSSGLQFSF